MKKLVFLFASLFITVIAVQNVNAQNPEETANATASATIIKAISIQNSQALRFGNIIASTDGGTVTIKPTGDASYEGVKAPPVTVGTLSAATFTVEGEENESYTIALPKNDDIVLKKNGAVDMKLTSFVHNAKEKLNDSGKEEFNVGATLNVNAKQASGTYEGEFNVTVAYN